MRSVSNEWRWVSLVIAAFVFTPELRRLIDWKVHFSSIDIVSPLPLLMLLPVVAIVFKQRKRLTGSPFIWIMGGWAVSFGYGVLIGVIQKAPLTAIYAFATFALPVSVGAWVLTLEESARSTLERFARLLLLLGGISGAYGIFQFIVAPPWDTAWMQAINAGSFGDPVPFGIRVFSVLNGPGVFATFLASVIIMTVTFLDIRKFWELFGVASIFVSLILTMVRTSWLEVIVGLAVLALVHPRRLRAVSNIVLLAIISIGAVSAFLVLSPDETFRLTLNQRFSTFQDLGNDGSAIDRANSAHDALKAAIDNPQGAGLGASGTAAKLSPVSVTAYMYNPDPAIDNGYISRFYETGIFGFATFLLTMLVLIVLTIAAFRRASSAGNRPDMEIVAVSLAFTLGTLGSFYGGDSIEGIAGVLFFIMAALPCRVLTELRTPETGLAGLARPRVRLIRPVS
jgi:hypothetical protein